MDECLTYHTPVLLKESVNGLEIKPEGTYVDVTFGGGGHSGEIIKSLGKGGRLFGFDQDADAEKNCIEDKRFVFVRSNFRYLENFMDWYGVKEIDGILADLGVSSHHFDERSRGFSFRYDESLDMRMNRGAETTAARVLNTYSEESLARVFFEYGEIRESRKISKRIVLERTKKVLETSEDLIGILKPFSIKGKEKKLYAQAFQALRIEVNDELGALKDMLLQARDLLKSGGRLSVITYHSLEDRIVKNFFKSGNFEGRIEKDFFGNPLSPFRTIGKIVVPGEKEIEKNPRSRSAKLRIAEKI